MVLVVEDESSHTNVRIRHLGLLVLKLSRPQMPLQAVMALSAHPEVDTLFSDLELPGDLDGLTLAHHIHEHRPDIGFS